MISSFRNFAKTKFAGLLVFLMIIPFVFWGMGSMFSSGNTNNLAKINNTDISTQEFIDYLNTVNISQKVIRENLDNDIIQELLSGLISTTLLDLEIENFDIHLSKITLLKKIKKNKNFLDENDVFQRTKYEKFLLENNISAPIFEQRLKERELQKNLFDYIGAGTVSPKFLISKLYEEENKKLELDFINLEKFYKENEINDQDLINFINENNDKLKIEYIDFKYSIINPQNLIGVNDFNQVFFDKIDQIESDLLSGISFDTLVSDLNLKTEIVNDFRYSEESNEIEKKIFQSKDRLVDIFENGDDFVIYNIKSIDQRKPNLNDIQTKKEIIKLVSNKNKYEYNKELLKQIRDKNFTDKEFLKFGKINIKTITLNSIKDNFKFDIDAVKMLYSMPINSYTLINDINDNIYLAKIKNFKDEIVDKNSENFKSYNDKEITNNRNNILKSYDLFLNNKYKVEVNQKTVDRVKNFFQ
jgi:peptidyl-prolyl cis-trans isomerase D